MKKLQRFFLWLIALSILIMPFKVMGEEESETYTLYDAGSGYEEKTQSEDDAFALFEENAANYDNLVLKERIRSSKWNTASSLFKVTVPVPY